MEASQLLFLLSLSFIVSFQVMAHSGGTNRYGCHAGSLPCHCHTPKEPKPHGIDPCSGEPLYTTPYRPPESEESCYPDQYPKCGHPKNKVTAFYDKISGSIAYSLKLIQKKPSVVQSCEEWVMVMKLMSTIRVVSPRRLASLEGKCYDTGYRRFSKYMVKLIDRLPI